jgi:hypothetical protein
MAHQAHAAYAGKRNNATSPTTAFYATVAYLSSGICEKLCRI